MLPNIKLLRKAKGVTQQQLAEAIGVSQQSVNKYENHNIEPDITTLIRMANFFGTSIDFIVGRSDLPIAFDNRLSREEYECILRMRRITKHQREALRMILAAFDD